MPKTTPPAGNPPIFLFTNIGRGHPSYLDGVIAALQATRLDMPVTLCDVFTVSKGLSRLAWKLVRALYKIGSRGGVVSWLYSRLRGFLGKNSDGGILLRLLGRDIVRRFRSHDGLIVVAHPLLARILSPHGRVIYQHGEMVAPPEAIVSGCERIWVPLDETAEPFRRAPLFPDTIMVTGQCIDYFLVERAEQTFRTRLARLAGDDRLTVAMFSSGALPAEHVEKLLLAAASLAHEGARPLLFAGTAMAAAECWRRELRHRGLTAGGRPEAADDIIVLSSSSRGDDDRLVASLFDRFDVLVAPAHERSNWSVGLGVPQFFLCPHIGTFAPRNAALAIARGVAADIPDATAARSIGGTLRNYREDGRLTEMARRGYGHTAINGFDRCARDLIARSEINH